MRIPHFAGLPAYALSNPYACAQTSTHNAAQPAMNMPQDAAHQIAVAYSMQSVYPHGGIQAAALDCMEPQNA